MIVPLIFATTPLFRVVTIAFLIFGEIFIVVFIERRYAVMKKPELHPFKGKRTEAALVGEAGYNARNDFHNACVAVVANMIFSETSRGRPERVTGRTTFTPSAKWGRVSQRLREVPTSVAFLEFVRSPRHRRGNLHVSDIWPHPLNGAGFSTNQSAVIGFAARCPKHRLALFRDVGVVGQTQGTSGGLPKRLYSTAVDVLVRTRLHLLGGSRKRGGFFAGSGKGFHALPTNRLDFSCTFQEFYERLSKIFANYAVFHLGHVFTAVLLEKQRTTLKNAIKTIRILRNFRIVHSWKVQILGTSEKNPPLLHPQSLGVIMGKSLNLGKICKLNYQQHFLTGQIDFNKHNSLKRNSP